MAPAPHQPIITPVQLTFLGTSAGSPTRSRNVTAQLLRFDDGQAWLLDCGEATQHRIIEGSLRAKPIERILITHLHGDHCYGLPGLLSLMAIQGRDEPVELIGPPGIRSMIRTVLRLSCNRLPYRLDIREIAEAGQVWRRGEWTISAWPLVHRIPSHGYVLEEDPRPGRFHPDRATALGLSPGPDFARLRDEGEVVLADGRRILRDQVCDPPRPGRKLVLLGDTADSQAIHAAGQACDLLVHEATYSADREAAARQWGHSTAAMAGACAQAMAARRLVITHVSARYDDAGPGRPGIGDLVAEAAAACPGTTVEAAHDGHTVTIA